MYFSWLFLIILLGYINLLLLAPWEGYLWWGLPGLCLLWFGDYLLSKKQPRLEVVRSFPDPVIQDQPVTVYLKIHNPLAYKVKLFIKDEPPFAVKLLQKCQTGLTLKPGTTAEYGYQIVAPQRGAFAFGSVNLRYTGRLRLFSIQYQLPTKEKLRIYPDLRQILNYRLERRSGSLVEGPWRRKLYGPGGELAQLREYNSGDDYRRINWKVSAHSGKPIVNEFQPEQDQSVFLLFDTGRLLFDQIVPAKNRLDYILDSALLLAYNILECRDMVGALSFNFKITRFVPLGKGFPQLQMLVANLFDLEAEMVESDYRQAFQFWQNKTTKRSLVFVYTELCDTESSRELINHLLLTSSRHLVVCVLLKQSYLETFAGQPVIDEKSAYLKGAALELQAERDSLKQVLYNHGIKILEVDCVNINRAVVEHYLYLKHSGLF